MTINQNMRELRRISGLTQAEVAQRVGLTRQAISSYESGRTQPDLDMLVRLAELYQADVADILYGRSREQRKLRAVKTVAAVSCVAALALVLAASGLLLTMNTFLAVPDGLGLTEATRPIVELRFALLEVWTALQRLSRTVSGLGCLVLAVLLTQLKRLPPMGQCALAAAAFGAGALVCTAPLGAFDRVYSRADYLLTAWGVLPPVVLLLLYRAVLGLVRDRRRRVG